MIIHPLNRCTVFNLGIVLLLLAGCASTPPTRFYTLNSLATADSAKQSFSVRKGTAVGVGPIEIGDYLDRPQIVSGVGANQIRISEFDRWAGNLRDNISVVLAENLSVLLSTNRVYVYPWKQSTQIDYRVEVSVIRFHGMPDDTVVLRAHWTIHGEDGKPPRLFRMSNYNEKIDGQGYDALVEAKNLALAELSREIAEAVSSVEKGVTEN